MGRSSTIDQLPEEIRSEIGRLLTQGATLDTIVEHLRTLHGAAPSRSALGRHAQKLDGMGEKLRRSRTVAEALMQKLGDAPASRAAQLNIELLHGAVLDLHMRAAEGEEVDEGGKAALAGNPQGVMLLSKAIDHLTSAAKKDAEFVAQVEERATAKAKRAAAAAVETVAREKGISPDTLAAIKAGIFGVAA